MTSNELIRHFNNTFGLNKWPDKFEVDAETYGNCCQHVISQTPMIQLNGIRTIHIAIGSHQGLLFKNVELIKR